MNKSWVSLLLFTLSSSVATAAICPVDDPDDRGPGSGGGFHYGGVSLSKTADLLLQATDIEGAAYDQATGQIIFYGKKPVTLPAMNFDDFAVAVRSVYGLGDKPPQNPGVSIGTEASDVAGTAKVRYDGDTANTQFGQVMFEADRQLKSFALGIDNVTKQPVTIAGLPDYKSKHDLYFEDLTSTAASRQSRTWYEPGNVVLKKTVDGSAMVFDEVSMRAFDLNLDPVTGAEIAPSAAGQQFADYLTVNYDKISDAYPVFKELKRLGKITAVVKWIRENNIPLDLSFLEDYQPEIHSTTAYTPEATVTRTEYIAPVIRTVTVTGGVIYKLNPSNYVENPDAVANTMMQSATSARPGEGTFSWAFTDAQGSEYIAIAQSLERSRKDGNVAWAESDIGYPTPGDLALNHTRYYDSFNDNNFGFGKGWYSTPYSLRFAGLKLSFSFGATPIIKNTHYDFYFRVGGSEELFTLNGLDVNEDVVYQSESQKYVIKYNATTGVYRFEHDNSPTIELNDEGRVIKETDRNGLTLTYQYNQVGNIIAPVSVTHSNGRQLIYTHNATGLITSITSPAGSAVTYTYNAANQLARVQLSPSSFVTYAYNADNLLTNVNDAQSHSLLTASYDDYKRADVVISGSTSTDSKDFNLTARKTTAVNERSLSTTQYFDNRFRLLTALDSLSRQVDYEYQSPFGVTRAVDPKGATTNYSYDSLGNVRNTVTHYGDTWGTYYNSANLLTFIHDPTQKGSYQTYDANKRLKEVFQNAMLEKDAAGNLTGGITYDNTNKVQYNYDLNGNIIEVIDASGNITRASYNLDGLLIDITAISGRITHYEYDIKARLTRVYDGLGTIVSYEYDQDDRLTATVTPSSRTTYTHDASGNMVSSTDGRGYSTTYQYDQDNNLTYVTDALGGVTQYAYDGSGNLELITLANGETLRNQYDVANRHNRSMGF